MLLEKTYTPNYPLNEFVDFIWVGRAPQLDIKASHHAPLFTELIFNYGDSFNVKGQNIESLVNKNDHHIISGLKTAPFQTEISGEYRSIGLILKPFCYGILVHKFGTNAMEKVSEILYEYFYIDENNDFSKVEKYLLQLFDQLQFDSDLIQFERYLSSTLLEKGALQDFNLSISISQKSFIHKFKKHYLLTPSEYIKLKKVNSAIELLQSNHSKKMVEIGLESGFYDQSHFIRLFKKFCGVTPKEFIKYSQR
jgi:AraC-like DNA-binding protein